MGQYFFTQQSQEDLIQVRHFTKDHWGEKQSTVYLKNLKNALKLLSDMPSMGKNCVDDLGKDIFRFPSGAHMIYYLAKTTDPIVVIAILHQSMVPSKHLNARIDGC